MRGPRVDAEHAVCLEEVGVEGRACDVVGGAVSVDITATVDIPTEEVSVHVADVRGDRGAGGTVIDTDVAPVGPEEIAVLRCSNKNVVLTVAGHVAGIGDRRAETIVCGVSRQIVERCLRSGGACEKSSAADRGEGTADGIAPAHGASRVG